MENEHNVAEYDSILDSINESSTDDEYDDRYISTNTLGDIRDGNYVHPDINTRDTRFKIRDCIRQTRSEWKGAELSEKRMGKGLHKVFNDVVNK